MSFQVTVGTFDKRIKTYDLRMNNNNNSDGIGNVVVNASAESVPHVEDFKFHRLPVLSVVTNPNDVNQVHKSYLSLFERVEKIALCDTFGT